MSPETELLFRYVDGELSPLEAQRFRARLAESATLRAQLRQVEQVGVLVRGWAEERSAAASDLVEPTLLRAREPRRQSTSWGYALAAALLLLLLPWSQGSRPVVAEHAAVVTAPAPPAAIERVEAADRQAQVFTLGSASTPVVWLADDAIEDDASDEQDPG